MEHTTQTNRPAPRPAHQPYTPPAPYPQPMQMTPHFATVHARTARDPATLRARARGCAIGAVACLITVIVTVVLFALGVQSLFAGHTSPAMILVMFGLLPIGMLAAGATVGFTICTIVAWTAWSDLRDARASCQAHAAGPPDSAR